jgi:hypothetical protein
MMRVFFAAVHNLKYPLLSSRIEIITSSTRSKIPIRIPIANSEFLRNSLLYKCIKCWNRLPRSMEDVKSKNSEANFVTILRLHIDEVIRIWEE